MLYFQPLEQFEVYPIDNILFHRWYVHTYVHEWIDHAIHVATTWESPKKPLYEEHKALLEEADEEMLKDIPMVECWPLEERFLPLVSEVACFFVMQHWPENFPNDGMVTNAELYWSLTVLIMIFFFFEFGMYEVFIIPKTVVQYIGEFFYNFIYNLIFQQVGKKGEEYFPLFFFIFFLILFSNLIGLTPYGFTNTSSLIQTLWLSCTCLIGLTIIGFHRQGLGFLKLFVPSGVPQLLVPLLVVIEVVSYLIRPISLGVRLFANMMSGHSLLYILSGFVLTLAEKNIFFAFFPFAVVLAISFLELGIAFLQAYVFVVLLCMYLNDSFNAGH